MSTIENHGQTESLFKLKQNLLRSPYPLYDYWRKLGPIVFLKEYDIYIVTRQDLIKSINRNPKIFSNQNPLGPSSKDAAAAYSAALKNRDSDFIERAMTVLARGNVLFTADPPEHTRHRRLLNGALKRSAIEKFKDQIKVINKDLITKLPRNEVFNIIEYFTVPSPIRCLAKLLDVPAERDADFYRWANAINSTIGTSMSSDKVKQVIEDQMDFWSFFENELKDRENRDADDLLTAIANAQSTEEAPLKLSEKVGFCAQLVGAGADTTSKLLDFSILALAQDPKLQKKLRSDKTLIEPFLEEILRLEPPVQGMFRVTTEDITLETFSIPRGAHLWLLYAAANRDENAFVCPHQINLDRPSFTNHLSFGSGPHVCIGANLAREVAKNAIYELLEQTEAVSSYQDSSNQKMLASYIMHGFTELLVILR